MNKKIVLLILSICIAFISFSCSSDDDDKNLEKYFTIEDAGYSNGDLPKGDQDLISGVSVNKSVINGGSTFVTINSKRQLSKVYLGVKGEKGFYEYNLKAEDATVVSNIYVYKVVLLLSQKLNVENFALALSVLAVDGGLSTSVDSNDISVVEVGTGLLQVSLSWDQLDDVDLHLIEPDGNRIYFNNEKSYRESDGAVYGFLDLDSNPNCRIDAVNNENITYEKFLKKGIYKVYVNLYNKCVYTRTGASYSVSVYYKGKLLSFSDKQIGKFADTFQGSTNKSNAVEIGSFTINEGDDVSAKSLFGKSLEFNEVKVIK